ncbi:MAG: alkaline phosphatase family protein [Ahniella sp.]|nr:alkaline phosphatase family protein [Ahniella sp.]
MAWSSFATGLNPGGHGIFDFLHRDTSDYSIDFSIAEQLPPETISLLGMEIPTSDGALVNRRQGQPFWLKAEHEGLRVAAMRVPVTYPVDPITHMLAGMGVPDLLGTQGTYTLIANHRIAAAESGGRVLMVRTSPDGSVQTELEGPNSPSSGKPMTVPVHIRADGDGVRLKLDGQEIALKPQQWSEWLTVRFRFLGLGSVDGMVRARLVSGFPRMRLYLTPIHVDPRSPALPISAPAHDAEHLAETIGVFHTLGMPEETWSMNQDHLDEAAWLDSVKTTLAEGEAMLKHRLAANDSDIIIETFVQPDRVSHMFWRGRDTGHPLHAESSDLARSAIDWIYGEADRIVGETRAALAPEDRLILLSDHGFSDYRRSAQVNRWLLEQGFLTLKPGARESGPLFAEVDWTQTRAYAMGLNGIYVNQVGREAQGIVKAEDKAALLADIAARITTCQDPEHQQQVVLRASLATDAYQGASSGDAPDLIVGFNRGYRASWQTSLGGVPAVLVEDNLQKWSGDHCVAPELVPGVLLTSFPLTQPVDGIGAVGALILSEAKRPSP